MFALGVGVVAFMAAFCGAVALALTGAIAVRFLSLKAYRLSEVLVTSLAWGLCAGCIEYLRVVLR
jgi:hypothetical protein